MSISLNGFKIKLSADTFTAYVQKMPDNKILTELREKHSDDWFFYWHEGKVYGIPKVNQPEKVLGSPIQLKCENNLQLIAARIGNLLPQIFSHYSPLKKKPFIFLAQKTELVAEVIKNLENLPPILSQFKIIPKYTLEPKLVELRHEETFIGLFLRLQTRWQIFVSPSNLQNSGINLQGLYVVRRNWMPKQRRLVGKIHKIVGKTVYLSESFDEVTTINEDEVWIEGSKTSFSRCLKTLLGNKYDAFELKRSVQENNLLTGVAFNKTLGKMGEFLAQTPSLKIAPDLEGFVGDRISRQSKRSRLL